MQQYQVVGGVCSHGCRASVQACRNFHSTRLKGRSSITLKFIDKQNNPNHIWKSFLMAKNCRKFFGNRGVFFCENAVFCYRVRSFVLKHEPNQNKEFQVGRAVPTSLSSFLGLWGSTYGLKPTTQLLAFGSTFIRQIWFSNVFHMTNHCFKNHWMRLLSYFCQQTHFVGQK